MTTNIVATVLERTYEPIPNAEVISFVTNELPIRWSVRIQDGLMKVSVIGHDDSLNVAETKTTLKIDYFHHRGFDTYFRPEHVLTAHIRENMFSFPSMPHSWWFPYYYKFRMEIPVSCKKEMSIDFKSPEIDHDRILVVQGVKFYIQSTYLSTWSKYFAIMFNGQFAERDQKEIVIEEVDPMEFEELLKVIHPSRKAINASNVDFLWKLADRFEIPGVIFECEEFLTTTPGKMPQAYESDYVRSIEDPFH